ncbi:MAG: hypothetical protein WD491_02500 [Balneolales bacterium]
MNKVATRSRNFLSLSLLILFICVTGKSFAQDKGNVFTASYTIGEEVLSITGTSTYVVYPSMSSIYLETESGNCGIHITYLTDSLKTSVYSVGAENNPQTRAVCVREDSGTKERISSDNGELVIEEINSRILNGSFNFQMTGNVTGIKYIITGDFVSHLKNSTN